MVPAGNLAKIVAVLPGNGVQGLPLANRMVGNGGIFRGPRILVVSFPGIAFSVIDKSSTASCSSEQNKQSNYDDSVTPH